MSWKNTKKNIMEKFYGTGTLGIGYLGVTKQNIEMISLYEHRRSDGANQMSRTMNQDIPKFSDDETVFLLIKILKSGNRSVIIEGSGIAGI